MSRLAERLRNALALPETAGLDLDAPELTARRRAVIRGKPFLRRIYLEWYAALLGALPPDGRILEIGSGGGFLQELRPGLLTSDILPVPGLDVVLDARHLPFPQGALDGVAMVNVLHHIPDPSAFFDEAARCVRPGGAVAMLEPWVTPWSRLVYTRLHHEPFAPQAAEWRLSGQGALSDANGALPWILFQRDRARFENRHPQWRIRILRPCMPFRYLLSGGVSMRALAPAGSFALWRALEDLLSPWMNLLGMFALIVLERTP